MSIIKKILEADINLNKDQYSTTNDDSTVPLNFEHALFLDLKKMLETLSVINNKLNNPQLHNEVNKLYSKAHNFDINLHFEPIDGHENPIKVLHNDINMAADTIKNILNDIKELNKL